MKVLLLLVLLSSSEATEGSCSEIDDGGPDLVALLHGPDVGRYSARTLVEEFPIDASLIAGAKAHFESALGCAYTDDANRQHALEVWRMMTERVQVGLPVALISAVEEYSSTSMEQEFQFLGAWFRSRTTLIDERQGSAVLWEIIDRSGRVHWQIHNGEVSAAWRTPDPGSWETAIGAMGVIGAYREQILAAYRLATLQDGGILKSAQELRFMASFMRSEDLDLLSRDPGNGLQTTPGFVEGILTWHGGQASLHVEWRDCLDAVLVSQELFWEDMEALPSVSKERKFLPGSDVVIRLTTARFRLLGESDVSYESIAWQPLAGQRIVDTRFQGEVNYFVEPDGTLIEDADIVLLAEQQAITPVDSSAERRSPSDEGLLVSAHSSQGVRSGGSSAGGVMFTRWTVLAVGLLALVGGVVGLRIRRREA